MVFCLILLSACCHIALSAPQYDVRPASTATQAPFIPPANNFQKFQTEEDFPPNLSNNPFFNEFPNTESVITTRFKETTFSFNEPTKANSGITEDTPITETLDVTFSTVPMQTSNPATNNTSVIPEETNKTTTTQPSSPIDKTSELDSEMDPNETIDTFNNQAVTTSKSTPSIITPLTENTQTSNDNPNYPNNPFLNGEITTNKNNPNPKTTQNPEESLGSSNSPSLENTANDNDENSILTSPKENDKVDSSTAATTLKKQNTTTSSPNKATSPAVNITFPSSVASTTTNSPSSTTVKTMVEPLTPKQETTTISATSRKPNNANSTTPLNKKNEGSSTTQKESFATSVTPKDKTSTQKPTSTSSSPNNEESNDKSPTETESNPITTPQEKNTEKSTTAEQIPSLTTVSPTDSSTPKDSNIKEPLTSSSLLNNNLSTNDDKTTKKTPSVTTNKPNNASTTANKIIPSKNENDARPVSEENIFNDNVPNYADNPFLNGEITTAKTSTSIPSSSTTNTENSGPSGIKPYLDDKKDTTASKDLITTSKPIDPSTNNIFNDITSTSASSEEKPNSDTNLLSNEDITTSKTSTLNPTSSTASSNEILSDGPGYNKPNYEDNIFLNGEFSGAKSTSKQEPTTSSSTNKLTNSEANKSTTKRDTTQTTTMPTTSSQNNNATASDSSSQRPTTKIVSTSFLPFTTGKTTTPKSPTDNENNSPIIFLPFSNGKVTTEKPSNPDSTNSRAPNEETTPESTDSTTLALTTNKSPFTTLSNPDRTSMGPLTTNRNPMTTTPEPILDIKFPDLNELNPVPVNFPRPNGQMRPLTPPRKRPANLDELLAKITRNPQVPVDPNSKPSSLEILLQLEKNRSDKLYKQLETANLMNNQLLDSNKNLVEENILLKQKFQNTDLITRLEKECYGIKNNLSICEDERDIIEENLETLNNTKNDLRTELNMCYFVQDQIRDRLTELTTTEMPKTTLIPEDCNNNLNQLQAENEVLSMKEEESKNMIADIKNTTNQCFNNIFDVANRLETYSIYNETLPLYRYLYTAQEYLFGPENYLTLRMKLQYGITCNLVYLYDEGYAVISDVLQTRRRVLGELHPDTLKTMYYLADNLSLLGFYGEAEDMYKYVLEKQSEILGDLHPDTETTKIELVILSHHNGNLP